MPPQGHVTSTADLKHEDATQVDHMAMMACGHLNEGGNDGETQFDAMAFQIGSFKEMFRSGAQ